MLSTEPTAYHSSPSGFFPPAGEILRDEVFSEFAVVVENPYHAVLNNVYHRLHFVCFRLSSMRISKNVTKMVLMDIGAHLFQ